MYLAGMMTTPEQRARFTKKQLEFEDGGWDVINPTNHIPGWTPRPKAMSVCLDYIDMADVVFMLYGWEASEGAKLRSWNASTRSTVGKKSGWKRRTRSGFWMLPAVSIPTEKSTAGGE